MGIRFLSQTSIAVLMVLSLSAGRAEAQLSQSGEIFSRLMVRVASKGTGRIARATLAETEEGRTLCKRILELHGKRVPMSPDALPEATVRALKEAGDVQLARRLELRLNEVDQRFIRAMDEAPARNASALLRHLAKNHLRVAVRTSSGSEMGRIQFLAAPTANARTLSETSAYYRTLLARQESRILEVGTRHPSLKLDKSLEIYKRFAAHPEFARILPRTEVYAQLADEEMTYFSEVLGQILTKLSRSRSRAPLAEKLARAVRETLRGKVPADTITSRVNALLTAKPGDIRESFRRALGSMDVAESNRLFHGVSSGDVTPANIAPESLLGQYIRETGAQVARRRFSLGPERSNEFGPERLVVTLSQESFPAFQKYLSRREFLTIFGHAHLVQGGKVFSYTQKGSDLRFPEHTNVLPFVMLKTTEAQRMRQYFRLFDRRINYYTYEDVAMAPWNIRGYNCAKSEFINCTAWIGNMPIGDERVLAYSLPGPNGRGVVRRLRPQAFKDPELQRVWKVPGNMQFSEAIGQLEANNRGDFASPGWVITTLMGPTKTERVPVVFHIVPDHRAPIKIDFEPIFEAPI